MERLREVENRKQLKQNNNQATSRLLIITASNAIREIKLMIQVFLVHKPGKNIPNITFVYDMKRQRGNA